MELRQLRQRIHGPIRKLNVRLTNRSRCSAALLPFRTAVAGKGIHAVGLNTLQCEVTFGMLQRFVNLLLGEYGGQLFGEILFGLCHGLLPELLKRSFAIRNVLQEKLFQTGGGEGTGRRVEDCLRLLLAKRNLLVVGSILLLIVVSGRMLCNSLSSVQHIIDIIRITNQLLLYLVWQHSPHLCGKNIVIKGLNVLLKGHRKAPFVAFFIAFTFNTPQRAKCPTLGYFLLAEQEKAHSDRPGMVK